jgi:hypothetical protein
MRGKKRASTRFKKFREDILFSFPNARRSPGEPASNLVYFLENQLDIDNVVIAHCDEDECLVFDQPSMPTALFQLLRIADKSILLRDLENFSSCISTKTSDRKFGLYSALSLLVSINLVDYKIRSTDNQVENVLQFFIKDE